MADYTDERDQLRRLLDTYPTVARELQAAVRAGRIDGNEYWTIGKCGCIYGHAARAIGPRDVRRRAMRMASRIMTPLEWLVFSVEPGDTPATSPALALVDTWLTEWLAEHEPAEVTT